MYLIISSSSIHTDFALFLFLFINAYIRQTIYYHVPQGSNGYENANTGIMDNVETCTYGMRQGTGNVHISVRQLVC